MNINDYISNGRLNDHVPNFLVGEICSKTIFNTGDLVFGIDSGGGFVYGVIYSQRGSYIDILTYDNLLAVDKSNSVTIPNPSERSITELISLFNTSNTAYRNALYNLWEYDINKNVFLEQLDIPRCAICGERVDNFRYINNKRINICDKCFRERYFVCNRCGEIELIENLETGNDYYLCLNCQKRDFVLPYHRYYPTLKFYKTDNKNEIPLYLGVELEIDGAGESDYTVEKINSIMNNNDNFVYCSHDGSLTEGLEIITQPATLKYHKSISKKYKKLFEMLKEMGYASDKTTTCGLHVHFNRDFFSDNEELYISKLLYLIDKNWDDVIKFSRRNKHRMDRYAKKLDIPQDEYIRYSNKKRNHDYHYYAVNLSNINTIEFRMFKGSLNIDTFMATLQFVQSCIMIAKNKSAEEIQHMSFDEIMNSTILKRYWSKRTHTQTFEE